MTEFLAALCYLAILAVMVLAGRSFSRLKRITEGKEAGTWNRLFFELLTVLMALVVAGGMVALGVYAYEMGTVDVWSPTVLGVTTVIGFTVWDSVFEKGWFPIIR